MLIELYNDLFLPLATSTQSIARILEYVLFCTQLFLRIDNINNNNNNNNNNDDDDDDNNNKNSNYNNYYNNDNEHLLSSSSLKRQALGALIDIHKKPIEQTLRLLTFTYKIM